MALAISITTAGCDRLIGLVIDEEAILETDLAFAAKVLCSSLFVAGLERDASLTHSAFANTAILTDIDIPTRSMKPANERLQQRVTISVDNNLKRVSLSDAGMTRSAGFYGDQGCIIHPEGSAEIFFEPVEVQSALPAEDSMPWPMGSLDARASADSGVDFDQVEAAMDLAFANEKAYTAAFVAVYKGQIIGERYGAGATRETALVSWSMGKSLTATLIGVLMQQGEALSLDGPAPVPEWSQPGDPRGEISITHLLQMSSGLDFSKHTDPIWQWSEAAPDHLYVYRDAIDVFDFSVNRPLEHPPGTVGHYQNSDPLTLGYIVRRTVEARGQSYHAFPQTDLFDRIGVRKLILETDAYGNFVSTGFEYGRAIDWARLGMLYLNDGQWAGERILPEGFVEFVSTPAPAWDEPRYGGQFWLNQGKVWPGLPSEAYVMAGGGGQFVVIVPHLDLVVVRMGHYQGFNSLAGSNHANESLEAAFPVLIDALPTQQTAQLRSASEDQPDQG
ncbi:MAG: serine hydrolase [Pseudomonadota bacterium]